MMQSIATDEYKIHSVVSNSEFFLQIKWIKLRDFLGTRLLSIVH